MTTEAMMNAKPVIDDDRCGPRTVYAAELDGRLDTSFLGDSPELIVLDLLDYGLDAVGDTFCGWLRADPARTREYVESTVRSDRAVRIWKKRYADTCPLEFVDDLGRHVVRIIPVVLDEDTDSWVPKEVQ